MRRKKYGEEEEINMTPMLDVVFIMLIFFIVTASFVKEAGIDINRPPPSSGIQPEDPDKTSILVAINENDTIWVDQRMVDIRTVRANIERALAASPQSNVLVQADQNSTNQVLVKVMDAARLAGVRDISVATSK